MKRFITSEDAYVEIKSGKTIKYDLPDGYATLKETESIGIFEFSLYDKSIPAQVSTINHNALVLRKKLSKMEYKGRFYIEEEPIKDITDRELFLKATTTDRVGIRNYLNTLREIVDKTKHDSSIESLKEIDKALEELDEIEKDQKLN